MPPPFAPELSRIAVVGAGAMGSGIALAALLADLRVTLYDVDPAGLERARVYIEEHLNRKQRAISIKYLRLTGELEKLGDPGVIIEAAPEVLSLKQEIFSRLDSLYPEPVLLATNTSTLPVTAIAGAAQTSHRVGGMHFFNPAPVMQLVEIVRAAQTSQESLQALQALARKMGKTPVVVRDTPGFIVNRVARPFYGEALRLLGEGAAGHEAIDRLVREGGGFRMGPFQLMDLIGIDVNFAATRSLWEQAFYEPRYRPHPIQAQMVQAGRLGRKTGRGFYTYTQGKASEPTREAHPAPGPGETHHSGSSEAAPQVLSTTGDWAPGLADLCWQAGFSFEILPGAAPQAYAGLAVESAVGSAANGLARRLAELDQALTPGAPLLCQCNDVTLAEALHWAVNPERVIGFDSLFFARGPVVTLVASPRTSEAARRRAEHFCAHLGRLVEWVEDSPGLILPRIVCMLANEAAFALGEGVADADTIDQAMQLGANYPTGPLAWAKELGYRKIVAVLGHLQKEFGEERYRVAPLLRRFARYETRGEEEEKES